MLSKEFCINISYNYFLHISSPKSNHPKVSKIDMKEVMDTWLEQQGFPVVTVQRINSTSFRITQQSILDVKQKTMKRLSEKYNNSNNITKPGNSSTEKTSPSRLDDDDSANNSSISSSTKRGISFEDQLWHIPFTFITDKNSTETLVWIKEKGKSFY